MLRTEQKLSQNILCQGLCSKSALSKIENGTLQPDMMLAEALLQRLGISEREFTFWADEREAKIHEYRLSWTELSILNNIAAAYFDSDTIHTGINYFYQLDSYYKHSCSDIIFCSQTQLVLFSKLVRLLYREKRYKEIYLLNDNEDISILNYSFHFFGAFIFHYCQAAGECNDLDTARLFGKYAYYVEQLVGFFVNANVIKDSLLQDFSIDVTV